MKKEDMIQDGKIRFSNNGFLEKNLEAMRDKLIDEDNKDLVILIVGGVGNGKSALTLWCELTLEYEGFNALEELEEEIDLEELFHGWVYEHKAFTTAVRNNKGIFINYDEGYDSFYRRKAMSKKNTEALSMMWKYRFKNHIMFINFQNISDVEPDLLRKRVHAVIRVVGKGWFHFFNQKQIESIEIDKRTKTVSYPEPAFKGSFPDPAKHIQKIWKNYEKDNEESLNDQAEKKEEQDAEPTNWLSTGSFAEKVDVSDQTVRSWFDKGIINGKRLPNGDRRIPESEMEKVLEDSS